MTGQTTSLAGNTSVRIERAASITVRGTTTSLATLRALIEETREWPATSTIHFTVSKGDRPGETGTTTIRVSEGR